jgi:uncharacterized membrane protein
MPSRSLAIHRGRIRNLNLVHEATSGYSDRLAARAAAIFGSWGFIVVIGTVLVAWAMGGTFSSALPTLLLCLMAAIQAPIIMMGQNRAASRDRHAAEVDFEANVKAEHEILDIREHMDRELVAMHRKLDAILRRYGIDPAEMGRPNPMELAGTQG